MKNIYLLVLSLFCFSCTLEMEEYSKLEESNFFKNENDCKAALASLYEIMQGPHGGWINGNQLGAFLISDMAADILGGNNGWDWFMEHRYNPDNFARPEMDLLDKFSKVKEVTTCRAFVLRLQALDNISEDVKNLYIAEARVIRAYLLHHFYIYFGTVPIVPDELVLNPNIVEYTPRPSKEEYIKIIQEEIDQALPYLKHPKDQSPEEEYGRMNKGIAYMILMQLYMIEKDWEKVSKYGQEIIDLNYYELQDDYLSIFSINNQRNKEVIYGVPRKQSIPNNGNTWHAISLPSSYPWKGTKWGVYYVRWSFIDTFDSADSRLSGLPQSYIGTDGKQYNRSNMIGAIAMKYDEDPAMVGHNSNHIIVRQRYADVWLSMAEAENELNGPTNKARAYFNKVRPRTGLANLPNGLSQQEFRDAVLMERAHEFYLEGHRYQDLVRHGKFYEVASKMPNSVLRPEQIQFPIPTQYIIEYKGILKQNPGY